MSNAERKENRSGMLDIIVVHNRIRILDLNVNEYA